MSQSFRTTWGASERDAPLRSIEYLSPPAKVSMGDQWFNIANMQHFWIRRRFEVLQELAGELITAATEIGEVGCGHGLLQRQIEDEYQRMVTGFDLNDYALKQNVSQMSKICCYDIFQKDPSFRAKFDLIFLFDVLEHIENEDPFLGAVLFHLTPNGRLIVNVPAGQWAYSAYDRVVGHVRRYSIKSLREACGRSNLQVERWSYWGLPLVPTLLLRKLWLLGKKDKTKIISGGMDSRTSSLNTTLGVIAGCEWIPQKIVGSSLIAVMQPGVLGA